MGFFACRWVRPRLPLLAGDDLVGPARRRLERHLIGCPDCRLRLASLQGALTVLHRVAAIDPIPAAAPLWPSLSREIRESRRAGSTVWTRLLVVPAAAAVAAALMLVLGASWSARPATSQSRASRPLLTSGSRRPVAPARPGPKAPPRLPSAADAKFRRLDPVDYAVGIPAKVRRPAAGAPHRTPNPPPALH
jgi:hypothetical protein